jgi:MFS family permease
MTSPSPTITSPKDLRVIVIASSAGTTFEWYDFFIFAVLASIIAKNFFTGLSDTMAYLMALATFAVGFIFRPLGALFFGHIGDRKGRKGTFLYTIILMGVATIAIGLIPSYEKIGLIAPILLILMRILQGFALGGEYGGAAIYVAEHSPAKSRGFYTGWIQTSAAFGLIAALVVIYATRTLMGEEAFVKEGWRIPFLISAGLLIVSVYIRAKTHESPAFKAMESNGKVSKAPFKEAFANSKNIQRVFIALFGFMCAQGVIWYTSFFYTQVFLEKSVMLEPTVVNQLIIGMTIVSAPLYVLFASISDKLGRKPVMMAGIALAAVSFFMGFTQILHFGNPALVAASKNAPLIVRIDPKTCTAQFDPTGTAVFATSCDLARSAATATGIGYKIVNHDDQSLQGKAVIMVGSNKIELNSLEGLSRKDVATERAKLVVSVKSALKEAGYPTKADPQKANLWGIFGILCIFSVACTMLYGPMASLLVEMFPTRVRYTGLSLPYNIGTGWFGGLQPAISFAMVAASGNIFQGLWYPVIVAIFSLIVSFFFLKETTGLDLNRFDEED